MPLPNGGGERDESAESPQDARRGPSPTNSYQRCWRRSGRVHQEKLQVTDVPVGVHPQPHAS